MVENVKPRMAVATECRIIELREGGAVLDPWQVALARSLSELMDESPTAAVAKELRAVLDGLAACKPAPKLDGDDLINSITGETTTPRRA